MGQVRGTFRSGKGIFVKEGSVYYGDFEQGKRHGNGTLITGPHDNPVRVTKYFSRYQQ